MQLAFNIAYMNACCKKTFVDVLVQTIDGFTTAIMVVTSVCFVPASYAIFVVKERAVKAKHQQARRKACLRYRVYTS